MNGYSEEMFSECPAFSDEIFHMKIRFWMYVLKKTPQTDNKPQLSSIKFAKWVSTALSTPWYTQIQGGGGVMGLIPVILSKALRIC